MEKKQGKRKSRVVAISLIIAAIAGYIALFSPAFAGEKKDKSNVKPNDQSSVLKDSINATLPEENQLVNRLINDGIVDQVKGFIVEKRQNKLFINGVQQPDEIASKYLAALTKDVIRVEVFSFMERLNQHPDASLIQLILPVSLSSPCVKYTPRKDTC